MGNNKELPDHLKALVSGCISAIELVKKNELAYATTSTFTRESVA